MALPKAKTKKKTAITVPRSYDKAQLGEEPKWFDGMPEVDRDIAVIRTFNWYNYFFSVKELKQDLIEYAKKDLGYTNDKLKMLRASEDFVARNSAGSYVRMHRNGWILNDREKEVIDSNLEELFASGYSKLKEKEKSDEDPQKKPINPHELMFEKFRSTIGQDLFDLETEWVEGNYTQSFDAFGLIKKHDLKGPTLNFIADWVNTRLEEYQEALSGKDPEIKEAYGHMTKANIRAMIKTLNGILSDVDKSKLAQKAVRTTNKTAKKPSTEKLIQNLQYKKEDVDLKIASINPAMIVGAKRLVVVNTKYNTLTEFIAESRDGLSVKQGTSYIENYSTQDSRTVTIPKKSLSECIEAIQSKTQRQLNNYIKNTLKKENQKDISRRMNKDTIILKVE